MGQEAQAMGRTGAKDFRVLWGSGMSRISRRWPGKLKDHLFLFRNAWKQRPLIFHVYVDIITAFCTKFINEQTSCLKNEFYKIKGAALIVYVSSN